jgi:DegV family protein with EDD domain
MISQNPELSNRTKPGDIRQRRSVAIVTDSATALPAEVTRALGVQVAQMEITVNGKTFVDGPGGGLEDFYTLLRSTDTMPTTSAPKPGAWLDAFKQAATKAEQIFCITLASSLSAAHDAARVAAELAEAELPGVKVTVFDSRSAAGSEALLVLECARMARRGASLQKIEARAHSLVENLRLIAYLDTLEYIHRGGRVPRIAVWATNLLNIKPVLEFSAGNIGGIARPRSRAGAFKKLVKEATADLQGKRAHINVMHADAADEAEELLRVLNDRLECAEIFLTQFHPFMGTHTGPGLVGVSYWGE